MPWQGPIRNLAAPANAMRRRNLKRQGLLSRLGALGSVSPLIVAAWIFPGASMAANVEGAIDLEGREGETIFSYRGPTGPDHWSSLDEDWALCEEGTAQSPIDFDALGADPQDVSDIAFDYHESMVSWTNNGHTVMMSYEPGSSMILGGTPYQLQQFHYHTPGEHSLQGGARFEVEQHLVHRNEAGELAVVGVMIREGDHNPALPGGRRLDQFLPQSEGVVVEFPEETLDATGLLPARLESFRYLGSLTTPPCSEGVRWVVMTEPIEISRSQMRALLQALRSLKYASQTGSNNRPTQPLNGRSVLLDQGNP